MVTTVSMHCDGDTCYMVSSKDALSTGKQAPSPSPTASLASLPTSPSYESMPSDNNSSNDEPDDEPDDKPDNTAMPSSVRFNDRALIDVTSPTLLRDLAIAIARNSGLPVTTMGPLDKRVGLGMCSDVEAARRLDVVDDQLQALAKELIAVTGLRGRRANAFVDPNEPLTRPDPCLFAHAVAPDRQIHEMCKQQEASVWHVEEIDLASDHFDQLPPATQKFLSYVLAFFAASDGIVACNIASNMKAAFTDPSVLHFFAWQEAMEMVHSETYGLLLSSYIRDREQQANLRAAVQTLACVKAKADWAIEWGRPQRLLAQRLVAYACVEGIHFSSSFCAIFYLKKQGLMPGLCFSNELISRDEGMHTDFACLLHSKLQRQCDEATAHAIIRSAVDVELLFVKDVLDQPLLGMSAELMSTYVRFVANRLAISLGFQKVYADEIAHNPFDWMELISLQGKTNFFEKRVSEYQRARVMESVNLEGGLADRTEASFTLDAEF